MTTVFGSSVKVFCVEIRALFSNISNCNLAYKISSPVLAAMSDLCLSSKEANADQTVPSPEDRHVFEFFPFFYVT